MNLGITNSTSVLSLMELASTMEAVEAIEAAEAAAIHAHPTPIGILNHTLANISKRAALKVGVDSILDEWRYQVFFSQKSVSQILRFWEAPTFKTD